LSLSNEGVGLAGNAVYMLAGPKLAEAGLKVLQGKNYQALIVFGPSAIAAVAIKAVKMAE